VPEYRIESHIHKQGSKLILNSHTFWVQHRYSDDGLTEQVTQLNMSMILIASATDFMHAVLYTLKWDLDDRGTIHQSSSHVLWGDYSLVNVLGETVFTEGDAHYSPANNVQGNFIH